MRYFNKFLKFTTLPTLLLLSLPQTYAIDLDLKPLTSGPIVNGVDNGDTNESHNKVHLWGRAGDKHHKDYYLVARLKTGDTDFEPPQFTKVDSLNDKIGIIPFPELQINTPYEYQIGYIKTKKDADLSAEIIHIKNWDHASTGKFHTPNPNADQISFVFGSCFRYTDVLGFNLFDSDNDIIFNAISEQLKEDPANSFFLRIGDNVYLDPIGKIGFGQSKSLSQMRGLYKTVWGLPNYKNLLANTITYSQEDDHGLGFNNVVPSEEVKDAEIVAHAMKAFYEYQKWDGPNGSQKSYYSFSRGPAEFFVFDTRQERVTHTTDKDGNAQIPHVISDEQFQSFQKWIQNPAIKDKVKFVVSTIPLISSNDIDSWGGFPIQQKQVVETMLGNDLDGTPISKVFILTGDGHCTHGGTYAISNEEKEIGTLTEIMSSGLKAINFGKQEDFPDSIDTRENNGLHFVKKDETPIFPDSSAIDSCLGKAVSVIHQNVDSVFVRMDINMPENTLTMNTFNQNNVLLGSKAYPIMAQ